MLGWARRVSVTGRAEAQIRIATRLKSRKPPSTPRPSSSWPAASAPRFTAMYTVKMRPRRAGSGWALSQLSITVYRPTRAMPVARRRPNQATGFTKIGCISTAMAASPVKKAKVRTWPIRRTSGGARKVPTKNPAK